MNQASPKPQQMQAGRATVNLSEAGVSISPDVLPFAAAKEQIRAQEVVVELKKKGGWRTTPSVVDQFADIRYRAHVRRGPAEVLVLDLSKPKDVATLNVLLKRAHPAGAPQVVIEHDEKQVVGQKWLCCISYRVIEYQEIITRITHGSDTNTSTDASSTKPADQ